MAFKIEDLMLTINVISPERVELGFTGCDDASVMVEMVSCGPTNNNLDALAVGQVACVMDTKENFRALRDSLLKVLIGMGELEEEAS